MQSGGGNSEGDSKKLDFPVLRERESTMISLGSPTSKIFGAFLDRNSHKRTWWGTSSPWDDSFALDLDVE